MAYSLATKTTKRSAIILTLILIILCFVLYITFGPVGWLTHRAEQHQQQQQQWDQSKDLLLIHVVCVFVSVCSHLVHISHVCFAVRLYSVLFGWWFLFFCSCLAHSFFIKSNLPSIHFGIVHSMLDYY